MNNKGYNLVGKTFARLTVLKDTGKRDPKKGKVWLCECSCGNKKEVKTVHLVHGNTKSCGCLVREIANRRRKNKKKEFRSLRGIAKKSIIETLPSELQGIRSKKVANGMFLVFENGVVFRLYDDVILHCKPGKTNGYLTVTRMVDGKQKQFYVHRLLAEAFIPNPKNKSQVIFKDNNKENLSLDNLQWANSSEHKKWLYENNRTQMFKSYNDCVKCGQKTRREDSVCPNCHYKIISEKQKKLTIEKKKSSVEHLIEHIHLLTDKQKEVVEMRSKGMTYEKIGEELGKSRQAVESLIKYAEKRVHSSYIYKNKRESIKGNKLKMIRVGHQLTQSDVADLLGISSTAYSMKERGLQEFKLSEANKLAVLFDKPIEVLFSNHI